MSLLDDARKLQKEYPRNTKDTVTLEELSLICAWLKDEIDTNAMCTALVQNGVLGKNSAKTSAVWWWAVKKIKYGIETKLIKMEVQ